jgi:ElaB/YqjD/DUF883 family membrane-anchored ribosome-binding protein
MLNIADFGGFSGIAKLIKQVKDTGERLMALSTSTGVTEIAELKTKYIDALDAFRPGNTQGVASVANDFTKDADYTYKALKNKIKDPAQLKQAEKTFNECKESISYMLGIIVNALKKAS